MNRTIVPKEGPKLRLVEAAEKLFAERGFEVVSVRDITQAAGGNVAAVNYHFGSRDGLVEVVMTRYLTPVNEERLARLEAAERQWAGQAMPLEAVVDAFVRPLITQVEKSDLSEQLFYRLVGRIFGSHGQGIPPALETQASVLIGRFTRALGKALPTVAEEDLVWRLHFVVGAMIYMLTHGEALQRLSQGTAGTPSMAATLERFVRFAVAGLRDGVGSPPVEVAVSKGSASEELGALQQAAQQELDGGHGALPQGDEVTVDDHERTNQTAEQVPDEDQEWTSQAAEQAPDGGHRPPLQDDEVPDENQEWTSQAAEQAPDGGHGALLQDDGPGATIQDDGQGVTILTADQEPDGTSAALDSRGTLVSPAPKKRAKKAEQDSPQVMFEF